MKAKSSRCPYAVLNLPTGCNDDDIKDAYKRLSRLLHPDKRRAGKERDDAQEAFIELTNAFEILGNNTLRQAYDHFGHAGVSIVRHNPHQLNSLFHHLSKLHEDGMPSEALRVLHSVLEDAELKKHCQQELEYSADINIDLHLCDMNDASGMRRLEVKSTNVSMSAAVPMPRQTNAPSPLARQEDAVQKRKQQVKLSIGGQSDLENGIASSKSVLAATYKPRAETDVVSQVIIDRKRMETTLSSTHLLSSGTRMSAKMTRAYDWEKLKAGKLSFGFSSNRVLTMFQGRTVHAGFAFGVGSNLKMQYGVLSLVTWGFNAVDSLGEDEEDEDPHDHDDDNDEGCQEDQGKRQNNRNSIKGKLPPPRLSAKLVIGSQFPFEMSISQNNLHSPSRSGDATLSWGPVTGFRIKGMLNREIPASYVVSEYHESEFCSSLGIGLEHTPMSGLKWLLRYERPEGISVQIPIFVSRILSHSYLNDVVWYVALSFLIDEAIGELAHTQTYAESSTPIKQNIISDKVTAIQAEQRWLISSKSTINAEKQVNIMRPVATSKRKRETECNGLVIIKAIYYRPSDPSVSVNVVDQLQFYVQNSSLVLPASSKSLLLGFSQVDCQTIHQPEPIRSYSNKRNAIFSWLLNQDEKDEAGTAAMLSVRYKFKGNVFETSVGDNDSLHIPNQEDFNLGPSNLVS
ncbi:hypothetical protein ACHAWT_004972 [Skeletonema menzelii]